MSAYVMYGFDTAGTLAEETNDPRRNAPPAIIKALATAAMIGGLMILFALMAVNDIHDKNIGCSGLPYIVKQALGNTVGNIFLIDSAIAITVCCLAVHTSCIRMMFAMARDGRLPFGPQVARVSGPRQGADRPGHRRRLLAIVLLAINIGNQSAFLALTSVAIIMFYLAYLCVTGPMLLRRIRGTWPTPEHGTYFSLGRWGMLVNVFAVVYGAIVAFNIAWPRNATSTTRSARTTGTSSGPPYLFIGAVMLIGAIYYFAVYNRTPIEVLAEHSADDRGPAVAGDRRRGAMIAEGEFDYVIAGGGTAGCVVAARLSEDPDVSVCLLEAGPSDVDDAAILRLEDWMYLLDSGYDWDYLVEPQEKGNSFLRHARAKVLGGCSSHNSCIAFWTPREDLDEWAAMGCEGWSADECWPLIKRLETNDAPGDHHGRSGPVNIRTVPPEDPCGVAVLEAAAQAGLPTSQFNAGHTVTNGAGWFQINSGARQHADVVLARLPAPDPRQPAEPDDAHRRVGQPGRRSTTSAGRPASSTSRPICSPTPSRRRGARSSSARARSTPRSCSCSRASARARTCRSSGSTSSPTRPAWAPTSTTTSRASCSGTRPSR